MTTADIIKNFKDLVDKELENDKTKTHTLKELTDILTNSFKEASKKKEPKVKKAPSSYNAFMSVRMKAFKSENPDKTSKEIMSLVGAEWKLLSQEEKDKYKTQP